MTCRKRAAHTLSATMLKRQNHHQLMPWRRILYTSSTHEAAPVHKGGGEYGVAKDQGSELSAPGGSMTRMR